MKATITMGLAIASVLMPAAVRADDSGQKIPCLPADRAFGITAGLGYRIQSEGTTSIGGKPAFLLVNSREGKWAVLVISEGQACIVAEN